VAPDIHGPFSRENSVHEVDYINVRNSEEVRTLYIHAAAFGNYFLTRFKLQGGVPDSREFDYKKARNIEEVRMHAAAF